MYAQNLIIKSSHQGIEHNPIITILPTQAKFPQVWNCSSLASDNVCCVQRNIEEDIAQFSRESKCATKYNTSLDTAIVSYIW